MLLKSRLRKGRDRQGFDSVFSGYSVIDDEFYEELEETMIMGDLGGRATEEILDRLKEQVNDQGICDPQDCREILIDSIREQMHVGKTAYDFEKEQSVVMVIGVNGVGKTTSIGKLASKLKKQGRKVLIAAADTFRAAAGDQLEEWANRAGVDMIGGVEGSDPASVIYDAVNAAKARHVDVLLCDTAGRLHIDETMMDELAEIKDNLDVCQTILVVDAMTGQDAVNAASSFDEALGIDGVVLTKLDGDARGGAALSIRAVTGKPIKFVGTGEKLEMIEPFHPDRMASRILGMGDMLSFIEKAEAAFDQKQAAKLEEKLRKNRFTLQDYYDQLQQIRGMGDLSQLAGMMPGQLGRQLQGASIDEKQMAHTEAIILSMTPLERENPQILNASRKRRIAAGCGLEVVDVNRLLKQFDAMQQIVKQFSKGRAAGGRMHGFGRKKRLK